MQHSVQPTAVGLELTATAQVSGDVCATATSKACIFLPLSRARLHVALVSRTVVRAQLVEQRNHDDGGCEVVQHGTHEEGEPSNDPQHGGAGARLDHIRHQLEAL